MRRETPAGRGSGIAVGRLSFRHRTNVGRPAGRVLPVGFTAGPQDPPGPRPRAQRKQSVELHEARPGRGLRAGGGPGDGPAAGRLRASDLGQWRSSAQFRPQLRRPDHAGFNTRALRPVGSPTTTIRPRSRWPGRRAAGGSGNMRATRVRAAPPTARPPSCAASATAIATCSTATRPRSLNSGARPSEFLRTRGQRGLWGEPGYWAKNAMLTRPSVRAKIRP